jgi:ubiquinone/menaquinone biosynthesis C-methylase UbiE
MTARASGEEDRDKRRVAEAFDAAADHYDDSANSFLADFGRQSAELLELRPGARVLDCACGTGHAALPAAVTVGPAGRVLGIDLSAALIERAAAKARARGLTNTEFRVADMEAADFGDLTFDGVICVFGIFFVPDMEALVRRLWSLVEPGGKLVITTWADRLFEPANSGTWIPQLQQERPDLVDAFEPWDQIKTAGGLRGVLEAAGVEGSEVLPSDCQISLRSPEDWWTMLIGLGDRWIVNQLDPEARERVRRANLAWIREHDVKGIEINVLYATARKPTAPRRSIR